MQIICKTCGKEVKNFALGYCQACYMRNYRQIQKLKIQKMEARIKQLEEELSQRS
jgi:ribosomal protein L37E